MNDKLKKEIVKSKEIKINNQTKAKSLEKTIERKNGVSLFFLDPLDLLLQLYTF